VPTVLAPKTVEMFTLPLVDQHLEDVHVSEQVADIAWQEKLLKLISNKLPKNSTCLVETAVKVEVQ
jgi:hypothetical protein